MVEINLLDLYPQTKRDLDERGSTVTEEQKTIARRFDKDYFDGERNTGYGGYSYHPRFFQPTVKRFRDYYHLVDHASVLDVGCAKGFMLHDFKELMPNLTIAGLDISEYATGQAFETVRPYLSVGNAKEIPYDNDSFDLVVSINTVHHLALPECKQAIREIQRVSRAHTFIVVDAWRTDEEKDRMMKWNQWGMTSMHVDDWKELFAEVGYTGDYYWFFV